MSVDLDTLLTLPPGVAEATALIEHVDDCLHHGFTRLGPQQREALDAFAATFSGSPFEQRLADAVTPSVAVSSSSRIFYHSPQPVWPCRGRSTMRSLPSAAAFLASHLPIWKIGQV